MLNIIPLSFAYGVTLSFKKRKLCNFYAIYVFFYYIFAPWRQYIGHSP